MSRIGKKPIAIPQKTTVTIAGQKVSVKGPLGELSREFSPVVAFEVKDGAVHVTLVGKGKDNGPMWGTVASHIGNMVSGVNTLYMKKLLIEGVGYKADAQGQTLNLALGFSHPVKVPIPKGITVKTEKGEVTVSGIDKEAVGAFTAYIRSLKKPEPYKGKGFRYADEVIRRKQGKKAA
jgi:large subunit ribosomal protein L6